MGSDANLREIIERAIDVFGSEAAALDWADKRPATLGGTPGELAMRGEGKQRVLLHLAGISRHRSG